MAYEPHTVIPDYAKYPLGQDELHLAKDVEERLTSGLNAILRKRGSVGMMVKVEIAAIMLTHVLAHSTDAAETMHLDRDAAHQHAIDIVVRRAREIYGQDLA